MIRFVGDEAWHVELDSSSKITVADLSCVFDEFHQHLIIRAEEFFVVHNQSQFSAVATKGLSLNLHKSTYANS